MNLLYITECYTPHDQRFLRAIRKQTERIYFACLSEKYQVMQNMLPRSVFIWPALGKSVCDWQRFVDIHEIDVVHAGPLHTVLPKVAHHIDRPLVGMSWGSDVLIHAKNDPVVRQKLLDAFEAVDSLITDCDAVIANLQSWIADFDIPHIQFPWGIEIDRFNSAVAAEAQSLRRQLGWGKNTVLVSTRTWAPLYGIPSLLDAFYLATKSFPDLRLLLIGDGPLQKEINMKISEYGLSDKIHCPGKLDEKVLPIWYSAADFYVSSSLGDGSSISLLEAMACRLPVIVHNGHGNLEWVTPGRNGWLVDCQDPIAMKEAIVQAVHASTEERLKMGSSNREMVLARADWNCNSKKIAQAYLLAKDHYKNRSKNTCPPTTIKACLPGLS